PGPSPPAPAAPSTASSPGSPSPGPGPGPSTERASTPLAGGRRRHRQTPPKTTTPADPSGCGGRCHRVGPRADPGALLLADDRAVFLQAQERVDAVLVVVLIAHDGRVEDAEHLHLLLHDHLVLLVAVEQVHRARRERVLLVVGQVPQGALAAGQPDGLDVVGVVEVV